MVGGKRRKRKVIDPTKISELGKQFFQYVTDKDEDWQSNMKKNDLRTCFMEEYKPWLLQDGQKPAYNFSTMIFYLRKQKKVKVIKNSGEVFYFEQTGYASVDQHRLFHRLEVEGKPKDRQFPSICEVCGVVLTSESQQKDHLRGARHRLNLTTLAIRKLQDPLLGDKHGVTIGNRDSLAVVDGKITVSCVQDEVKSVQLFVSYSDQAVSLELVTLLSQDSRLFITDEDGLTEGKVTLNFDPGQEYEITLKCKCRDFGEIRAPVAFGFKLQSTKELFHIFRVVIFSVAGGEDRDILTPTAPYSRTSKVALTPRSSNVLSGTPFTFSGKGKLPQKINMDNYYIPDQVSKSLNSNNPGRIKSLQDPLSEENYSQKFENLLYAEEHQMKVDIRRYDKKAAEMSKSRTHVGLLNLKVPGLAENRPSVLRGDHLYVTHSDGSRDKSYKGFVHHIEQEVVSLHFHADLVHSFIDKMKFDIQFTFSRFPLKLQHFAVDSGRMDMEEMKAILFPTPIPKEQQGTDSEELQTLRQRQLFNQTLARNTEQVQAVYHILRGSSLPAPYLVFGPPGTGKTVTVVEAMKQVYHQIPDSFILACAPSNSAADLIAKRLFDSGPVAKSHVLRMSALSRSLEAVDPDLRKKFRVCLNYDDQGHVVFPGIDAIREKRIVVVTMVTAGRLVLADSFKNHFTHIFLDEAGHAIEPEALISVTGLLPKDGQLVLAGDPKQLGPVLRSPISKQNGLELSLLERLMTTEAAYQRTEGVYNDLMLTKLLCNYRSHPKILCKPNEMFYDGELTFSANKETSESLSEIDQLPKKGFPVIFHGIEGKDEREESSPSFFNAAEVDQVKKYVDDLLGLRGTTVKQAQIGVISPYRKQVQKIKKVLARKNLTDIKVGSVEEFQGQERLVIIISTVRSTNKDFLKMDQDYKLGFLQNPKRFNVAITRAKALLICIGNPYMLRKDEHWKQFLDYCRENGGYTGCPYSPEEEEQEIEALSSKMVGLNIVTEMMTEEDASVVSDPAWRGESQM